MSLTDDLGMQIDVSALGGYTSVCCSLLPGLTVGLQEVRDAIADRLNLHSQAPPHAVISERHRALLRHAGTLVKEARDLLSNEQDESLVIAAQCIKDSLIEVGSLTGRVYTDELLDRIFSKFCVGK